MRTSYKFFAAAAAGLVIAGGSAYTNANTVPSNYGAGYGSTTVDPGVTVQTMTVNPGADPMYLDSVVYVIDGALATWSGWTFAMSGDGTTLDADCATAVEVPDTSTRLTCTATADTVEIETLMNIGLGATEDEVTVP